MTTQTEALKLSLEALEECRRDPRLKYEHPAYDKTITAIKETLAQPEQEPDDLTIAYMAGLSRGKDLAPQRTWVGLTDEEIRKAAEIDGGTDTWIFETAYAIEAKLKEKNT
jgi:hypothetical protein